MLLTKEIKTEIDFILSESLKGNPCSDNKQNTELQSTSIRICKSLNLIKLSLSGKKYELTESGILALDDGGIEKYLFNIRTRYSDESTPRFRDNGRHLFRRKVRQSNRPLSSLSKDDIFQS